MFIADVIDIWDFKQLLLLRKWLLGGAGSSLTSGAE